MGKLNFHRYFWAVDWVLKTIPILFLISVIEFFLSYKSIFSNNILPSILASGDKSCIRLKDRNKVDFPQPDGPIKEVT